MRNFSSISLITVNLIDLEGMYKREMSGMFRIIYFLYWICLVQ